ncbi:hypothetical protein SAY86_010153 [Trapa natans]|uniref:Uncharacterized protein n=1 Tax=Trapa natans TaxID=22666 RepID=A0AAN7QTR9_TRANT|nr:hypothetical protein SAY86_010153 [Trapa natans]
MPLNRGSAPPPMIAKMGPYTVFITPPPTPQSPPRAAIDPPVQPPPQQFRKAVQAVSILGFFKDAATKVQSAHSSLDAHLARLLGLDKSKYHWVLEDYCEIKKTMLMAGQGKCKKWASKGMHAQCDVAGENGYILIIHFGQYVASDPDPVHLTIVYMSHNLRMDEGFLYFCQKDKKM